MGSVDDNYKCPLCGRKGNGGYALDGIDYPICTRGDFSCLWFQTIQHNRPPKQIVGNAIRAILKPTRKLPEEIVTNITEFYKEL